MKRCRHCHHLESVLDDVTALTVAIRDAEAAARRDALEEAARYFEAASLPSPDRGPLKWVRDACKHIRSLAAPAPAKRAETEGGGDV